MPLIILKPVHFFKLNQHSILTGRYFNQLRSQFPTLIIAKMTNSAVREGKEMYVRKGCESFEKAF